MIIKSIILKNIILLLSAVILLTFISCPQPLSDDDVVAAQDDLAPSIVIFTPSDSDIYYSSVDFTLSVTDDAESAEDNKGDLASISFDISNDDLRGGKVLIDPEGVQTQDASFGPDQIVYDAASGTASFSFSTIEPNIMSGLMSITIKAEDRNGNITTETITLADSEGPWLEYTITDLATNEERSYTEDTTIRLEGTLGNSEEDQETADQITHISWSVLGKAWSGTLEIDQDATYKDPGTGETLNYYNEPLARYERLNEGVVYPELFIYDPETRTFSTEIAIPFGAGTVLPFEVTVTDLNEHESTLTINAFSNESGPEIVINYPTNDSVAYYSGQDHGSGTYYANAITGFINGGTADLASLKYSITNSVGDKTYTSGNIMDTAFSGSNDFSVDISAGLAATVDSGNASNPIAPGDGTITVTLIAINDDNNESRPKVTLSEDSTGPSVSISSFVCNVGSTGYAKNGDSVTLSCTASDAISGSTVNASAAVINGSAATLSGLTATSSPLTGVSDGNLAYSMTVVDHLNNATTVTQASGGSHQVMHYAGDPDATHLEGSGLTSTDADATYSGYAVAGENIYVDMDFDRVITGISNISTGSFTPSVTMNYGGDSSKARITLVRSDAVQGIPANFSFDVTDAAGNVTSVGEGNSIDQGDVTGGLVIYDAVAPATPAGLDLDAADDSSLAGYIGSDSDNYTSSSSGLTISGSGETGSVLTLTSSIDGSVFTNTVAGGAWTTADTLSLSEGTHSLTARAVDPAGNVSGTSTALSLTIDTTPPAAPGSIHLNPASDTAGGAGTTSDRITSLDTVTFDDGGGDGAMTSPDSGLRYILYKESVRQTGSIQIDTVDGDWSKSATLTNNEDYVAYNYQLKAVDLAGNESLTSADITIYHDDVAPGAPGLALDSTDDTGISDSDGITNQLSGLTIRGSLTDNDTQERVYITAANRDTTLSIAGWNGSFDDESGAAWSFSGSLNSVDHQNINDISVVSYDRAGNSSSPATMELVLDTMHPTAVSSIGSLTLIHDDTNDTGLSNSDNITKNTSPNFYVSVTHGGELIPGTSDTLWVELTTDQNSVAPSVLSQTTFLASGTLTIGGTLDEHNSHNLTATLYDAAGNDLITGPATFGTVKIDNTAPSVKLDTFTLQSASDTGQSPSDRITNDTTPTYNYGLSSYSEASYIVLTRDGGTYVNKEEADSSSGGSITTSALSGTPSTQYDLTATIYDIAGNKATGPNDLTHNITIDTVLPTESISLDLPDGSDSGNSQTDNTTNVTAPGLNIVLSGTTQSDYYVEFSSNGSGDSINDLDIANGSSGIVTHSATLSSGTQGLRTITATLKDIAGNPHATEPTLGITLDTLAPAMSLTPFILDPGSESGSDLNDGIINDDTPSFQYTIGGTVDPGGNYIRLVSNVEIQSGGYEMIEETFAAAGGPNSITSAALDEGGQTVTATIYDIAGNAGSGTNNQPVVLSIDTEMNEECSSITLNSDTGVSGSDGITNDKTLVVTLDGAATEAYTVSYSSTGTGTFPDLAIANSTSGPYSYTTATMDDGAHTISAVMKDVAGNTSSPSDLVMTLDTVSPKLIGTDPIDWVDAGKDYLTMTFTDDLDAGVVSGTISDPDPSMAPDDMGELSFSDPSSFINLTNYKAEFSTNYTVIKITAYNTGGSQVNFSGTEDNIILNFTSDFTDIAGNSLKKADGTTDLTSLDFSIASGTVTINTGGIVGGLLKPEITLSELEKSTTPSISLASGYNRKETPTAVLPDKPSVTPEKTESEQQTDSVIPLTTRRHNDVVKSTLPAAAAPPPQTVFLPSVEEYNRINREALQFMEKVEETKQTHEELIEQIRLPGLSRESLKRMDSLLDPVIPEVEVLTIYSSPVPLAVETPVELAVEELVLISEEAHPVSYLLIHIFVAALIALITGLFLLAMKRLQRKE